MDRRRFYDSAIFWVAIGGAIMVAGGVLVTIGVAQTQPSVNAWSSGWFDGGLAAVALGVLMLLWAVALFLRHRRLPREVPSPPAPPVHIGPQIFHLQDQAGIYGGHWDVRTSGRPDGSMDFAINALISSPAVPVRHPLIKLIVEDFKAKVDGITDDLTAINAAIAHAVGQLVSVDRVEIIDGKTHEAGHAHV